MSSSEGKCGLNYSQESVWERQFLKEKCRELGIESEFIAYQIRVLRSYVSVFFIFHISVTLIHCILITTLSDHNKYIYFDVGIYVGSCLILILILSINFWEKLIRRHTWIMFVSSALACLTLAGADLIQSLLHHFLNDWQCGTLYNAYIIFMIYTFLPILSIHLAVILAVVVSCAYVLYFMNIIHSESNAMMSLTCDIALYICLNVICILFRIVNDMIVRSSFIDRHQFIKEELFLRNAQRQEKLLLDSIMPSQFSGLLQQDIQKNIILSQQLDPTPMQIIIGFRRSLAIQTHSDVSILYADIVNYTHLTTTLTVEKLVTTLHDLYARFDLAAQHHRVQRIKFLGDCYYCVAGLANADPDHANNAVALGIAMIAHIQKVRDAQELDIDMRIGVHSGSVYAGVIGETKLQYDVWGPDVTIANVLESTGVPGAVHISEAVLRNLHASCEFTIESGPEKAKNDPVLQKHNITTYIIVFGSSEVLDSAADSRNIASYFNLSRASSFLPKTVVNEELREEYRKMPVMGFDPTSCWRKGQSKNEMSAQVNICLAFKDSDMEKPYLKQRDNLSKYFMLLAWTVGLAEICIKIKENDHLYIWTVLIDSFVALFLTVMLFIAWYKNICWIIYGKKNIPHSYNRISCTIFRIHEKIQESLTVRVCTFLFIMVLLWILIGISMVRCHYAEFILQYIEERIFHYEADTTICFHPWDATSIFTLMTCLALSFSHIPSLLKTSVALAQVIISCILIFFQFDFVFHHSTTTNPYFPSEFSHAMIVVVTFVTMHYGEFAHFHGIN